MVPAPLLWHLLGREGHVWGSHRKEKVLVMPKKRKRMGLGSPALNSRGRFALETRSPWRSLGQRPQRGCDAHFQRWIDRDARHPFLVLSSYSPTKWKKRERDK